MFLFAGNEYAYSYAHPPTTPLHSNSIHLSHPPPGGDAPIHSPLNSPHTLSPTCITSPASSHMSTDSSIMGALSNHDLHGKSPTLTVVSPDPSLLPPGYGSLPSPTLQPPPLLSTTVPFIQDQSYGHTLSHPHSAQLNPDQLMRQNAVQNHPPVLSHPMVTAE